MARAQKHTRTETRTVTEEVTTYTLELSEWDRESLLDYFGRRATSVEAAGLWDLYKALEYADEQPSPTPLAVGDRVTMLKSYGSAYRGSLLSITDVSEADRGYVDAYHLPTDHRVTIPAWSEGNVWERVSEPKPLAVGDRVRVLAATHADEYVGAVGVLTKTDGDTILGFGSGRTLHPYEVDFDGGDGVLASAVERAS